MAVRVSKSFLSGDVMVEITGQLNVLLGEHAYPNRVGRRFCAETAYPFEAVGDVLRYTDYHGKHRDIRVSVAAGLGVVPRRTTPP
jgi:hypothetical protein